MKKFQFGPRDTIAMAQFIAELQRQGTKWSVKSIIGGWEIYILD